MSRLRPASRTDGLTYGTLSALIIADNLTGAASARGDLYRANRVTPVKSAPSFLEEQKNFASAFVRN